LTALAPAPSSLTLPIIYNPSPSAPAAAAVDPKALPAVTTVKVVAVGTVVVSTNNLSPVRALTTTSPGVKIYPELVPAPVTVTVTPAAAAYVPLTLA